MGRRRARGEAPAAACVSILRRPLQCVDTTLCCLPLAAHRSLLTARCSPPAARLSAHPLLASRIDGAVLLDGAARASLGDPLELRCKLRLRARDTMVVFEQWIVATQTGAALARADITCCLLDAEGGKMVAAPERLKTQLAEWLG